MWTITFDHYTVIFKDTRIWTDSTVLEATIESLLPEAVTVQATATGPFDVIKNDPTFQDPWIAYAFVAQILRDWMHVQDWTTEGDGDYLWPYDEQANGATAVFGNDCHDPHSGEFCPTEGGSSAGDESEASQDEYRGQHQPPRDSATIDDLANQTIGTFPSDVYDHPEFYDHTGQQSKADKESAAVIAKVRGNPEAEVTVYRAAPPGVKTINKGDWVAISEAYARAHAEAQAPEGEPPWPVYSAKVPAKFIHSGGNDIVEYGMWHDDLPATIVRKGGK